MDLNLLFLVPGYWRLLGFRCQVSGVSLLISEQWSLASGIWSSLFKSEIRNTKSKWKGSEIEALNSRFSMLLVTNS
jgi:hypothetical protein